MTDPLRDYLDSIDWQAFDDRLPDLCCDHLRSFLRYPDPWSGSLRTLDGACGPTGRARPG